MIEDDMYTYLQTVSGLTALVSTRIYPNELPQEPDLPAVVYHRITGARTETTGNDSQLAHPMFQLDAYAATYSAVKAVAEQLRLALQGYSGLWDATPVSAVRFLGDMDMIEPETGEHRVSIEIEVWHEE